MIAELNVDADRGLLTLRLSSGASPALTHAALRAACRCAYCDAGRRLGNPPTSTDDLRIVELHEHAPLLIRPGRRSQERRGRQRGIED